MYPAPTLAQSAENTMDLRRRQYGENYRLLVKDYRDEQETAEDYNGRQLLELLQNAADAAEGFLNGGRVLVRLHEGVLTVANTGEPFTEAGLDSILYSNLSPKHGQQNKIGAKGLGFRAVLGWAERIIIRSGGLHIAFSKDYARRFLTDLKHDYPEMAAALQQHNPGPDAIATLCCAEILPDENQHTDLAAYDTVMTLKLRPDVEKQVLKQIDDELDPEVLVFLNHLTELRLELPTGVRCLTRTVPKVDQVQVETVDETNGLNASKVWQLIAETGQHKGKEYELKVAWQKDLSDQQQRLYSYFRTQVSFPFPVLAHGTFELSSDRNSLKSDEAGHNRFLLAGLANLLVKAAIQLSESDANVASYQPLRLLNWAKLPDRQLEQRFEFGTRLREAVTEAALFPTISNTYISVSAGAVAYDKDFAAFLSPVECPRLLQFADSKQVGPAPIIELLKRLNKHQHYAAQNLIKKVSSQRKALPVASYASLLKLTVEQLHLNQKEEVAKLQLPVLFYGGRGRTDFTANSTVFLPAEGKARYELPDEANLQVLSIELSNGLQEAFGATSLTKLADHLAPLHVRPYSFAAVAGLLVDAYSVEKPEVWHPFLFELFKQERALTAKLPRWQQATGIRLRTSTGTIAEASTLYFGQAHGHKLGEELFSHNRTRLVGSAKRNGLPTTDSLVKEYLVWCGVDKYPRFVKQKVTDNAYREEILRTLDYKNRPIHNDDSRSYTELNERIQFHYNISCEADYLDDFEAILRQVPLVTIFSWIKQDERLAKRLELTSREPTDSKLSFWIKHKKEATSLDGRHMPSYLRWQCQRLAWLPVKENEERMAPVHTLFTRRAAHNLHPILYTPALPIEQLLAKPYPGLARTDIIRITTLLGIAQTVGDVPTNTLYELLLNLPDLVDARLAGTFYRELIDNYEGNPDSTSPNYQKFLHTGKVACQRGSEPPSYYTVQKAVYLDNASYGTAVVAHFPVLLANRRRGKDKIMSLFGVRPLENIKLQLLNTEPAAHPMQSTFAVDFDDLRGYILALRRSKNTTDSERISKLRIQLSQQVHAAFTMPTTKELVPVDLREFEFVYLPGENRAYVEVPLLLGNLADLKESFEFCNCLAEIICTALNVADDKDKYENLLSRSPTKRRSLLRTWLGIEAEPELTNSQQELNLATENQRAFWQALISSTGRPLVDEVAMASLVTTDNWLTYLTNEFGEAYRSKLQAVQGLDFTLPFSLDGLGEVQTLLQAMDADLNIFNTTNNEVFLDFRPLWQRRLTDLLALRYPAFSLALHNKLQTRPEYEQQQFQQIRATYKQGVAEFINMLGMDVEALFNTFTQSLPFEVTVVDGEVQDLASELEKRATATSSALRELAKAATIPDQTVGKFLNEQHNTSLLYFLDANTILKLLLQAHPRPTQTRPKSSGNTKRAEINLGGANAFAYDSFQDLAKQLDQLPESDRPLSIIKPIRKISPEGDNTNNRSGRSSRHGTQLANTNSETAFLGEYFAYRALCRQYGPAQVIWCSELAVEAGQGYSGGAGEGYDMQYIDNVGAVHYVEVKASTGELSMFHLSRNELKFGESNQYKARYELLLVSFATNLEKMQLERIFRPFEYRRGESFMDNANFGVEEDSFRLRFKRKGS